MHKLVGWAAIGTRRGARNCETRFAAGRAVIDKGVAAEEPLAVRSTSNGRLTGVDLDLDLLIHEVDDLTLGNEHGDVPRVVKGQFHVKFRSAAASQNQGAGNTRQASNLAETCC